MADLTITPANVVPAAGVTILHGIAGETITAGMAIYQAAATGKWMKADSNSGTSEARTATAIALCGSSLNQPISYMTSGDVTIGATMTANIGYFLSDTAGGICPIADVGTGEYLCQIGLSKSTTLLNVKFNATGVSN